MTNIREAGNAFWVILLQYAKLLGQESVSTERPTYPNPDWDDDEIVSEREKILADLEKALEDYAEVYPKIPSDQEITGDLKPLFLRLAATYQFYFREEDVPQGLEIPE